MHEEEHPKGTVYACGSLVEEAVAWRVAVVAAGMGNPSAALEVERAIAHFKPEIVLLVGVAGGLKDVKLGDVVAADKVHSYERGKAGEVFAPRPDSWAGSYPAVQRARQEALKGHWRKRIKGAAQESLPDAIVKPIAAGEKVLASDRAVVYELISQTYGDAVAVEMEGAGFFLATHANVGVDALVIRGISDLIVDKTVADAAGWQQQAARNAAAFAAEFLLHYRTRSATVRTADNADRVKSPGEIGGPKGNSKYDPNGSTALFHARICDAFPGCEGVCLETDLSAGAERLRMLLQPPLGDGVNSPIWDVGYGTAAIHEFRLQAGDTVHLDHRRYRVRQLAAYRSSRYWRDFVLLYWSADQATGLYAPRTGDEIAQCVERMGFCREEYGVWGEQLITRREYDDGSVFRHGRLHRADARLEVRNLAEGATFLVAQLSPLNDPRNDLHREGFLKEHVLGRVTLEDIVDWVESLPRHRRDSN